MTLCSSEMSKVTDVRLVPISSFPCLASCSSVHGSLVLDPFLRHLTLPISWYREPKYLTMHVYALSLELQLHLFLLMRIQPSNAPVKLVSLAALEMWCRHPRRGLGSAPGTWHLGIRCSGA